MFAIWGLARAGANWIEPRAVSFSLQARGVVSMDLSSIQGLIVVVGPILLAIAIAWAMFHNRGTRQEIERTEEATRMRYDQQNREDKAREAQ
jgi:hypothetical protein